MPRHPGLGRRHPRALWRFFLAVAFRLSPWRRVFFAFSAIAVLLGWLGYLAWVLEVGPFSLAPLFAFRTWLLLGATALFFLLTLELRDKLSLKGDLEVARQIQFGLLPFEPFEKDGIAIVSAMRPANTVGGDYFDVIELGEGRLAIAVGDVAGKGMPAALLMALLQGSLRTLLSAGLRGEELVARLNAHLCANIPSNRLITLFYGELDCATGRLVYVNAGHNPPFLLPAGEPAARLCATAMALGITVEPDFPSMEIVLDTARYLGIGIVNLMHTIDPNGVLLGGAIFGLATLVKTQAIALVPFLAFVAFLDRWSIGSVVPAIAPEPNGHQLACSITS